MMESNYPKSEFSDTFISRMKNAMTVSFFKYGPLKEAYPHKVDAIASLEKRLQLYKDTGNADYLTDIANFAMIESMRPAHPEHHYKPTDGGEGRKWHSGGAANERNNQGERKQR